MMSYLKSVIKANSLDSSKSFSLVVSCLVGGVIGITIAFCLIWDTVQNGRITSDLVDLGWFLISVGVFMAGGGASKSFAEYYKNKRDCVKPSLDKDVLDK